MSLKISHPCVQAEKVLTQQPSCCINCTMNFQVSTSKGRIINHDLSKILKTKHPSQSKLHLGRFGTWMEECLKADIKLFLPVTLTLSWWSCHDGFFRHHLSTARKIISTIHICHLRSMEHFPSTWAALGRCLQTLWAHRCPTAGSRGGLPGRGAPTAPVSAQAASSSTAQLQHPWPM